MFLAEREHLEILVEVVVVLISLVRLHAMQAVVVVLHVLVARSLAQKISSADVVLPLEGMLSAHPLLSQLALSLTADWPPDLEQVEAFVIQDVEEVGLFGKVDLHVEEFGPTTDPHPQCHVKVVLLVMVGQVGLSEVVDLH